MQKQKSLYRVIIKDAWQTTWRHKYLWLWGLFAALLGNAGEYQFIINAFRGVVNGERVQETAVLGMAAEGPFSMSVLSGTWQTFVAEPFVMFLLLLSGLVIIAAVIFFIWLSIVSVIALIKGTQDITKKLEPNLAGGFDAGKEKFGPVLVTYVMGRLVIWLLMSLLLLLGALAALDPFLGLAPFIIGFILIVPALFVVSFVLRFTLAYIVLSKKPIIEAISEAAELFWQNWLITFELAFLLFAINTVVVFLLIAGLVFIVLPIMLAGLMMSAMGLVVWSIALLALSSLSFFGLILLVGAVLGAFQWTAWIHLFLRLTNRATINVSKIIRAVGRFLPNKPIALIKNPIKDVSK